jgi:hypothetical protein
MGCLAILIFLFIWYMFLVLIAGAIIMCLSALGVPIAATWGNAFIGGILLMIIKMFVFPSSSSSD